MENSLTFGVIRSILGMTAPEWAELAKVELNSDTEDEFSLPFSLHCGFADCGTLSEHDTCDYNQY